MSIDRAKLIPVAQVAAETPRSVRWWREQCRAKQVEHFRLGREFFFTPQQAAKAIERFKVPADAPSPVRSEEDEMAEALAAARRAGRRRTARAA